MAQMMVFHLLGQSALLVVNHSTAANASSVWLSKCDSAHHEHAAQCLCSGPAEQGHLVQGNGWIIIIKKQHQLLESRGEEAERRGDHTSGAFM